MANTGRPNRRGMGAGQSRSVSVRVTYDQARRFEDLARKADLTGGEALRAVMEMALGDPVNVVKALLSVNRKVPVKVQLYVVEEDAGGAHEPV